MVWDISRLYRTILSRPRRAIPRYRPSLEALEPRYAPAVNVLTYHLDTASSGVNTDETQLTPANVAVNSFGKLYNVDLDGQVYAEPLVETGVTIAAGPNTLSGAAGVHDVVFVATQHDSLYAIDASALGGAVLWQRSFLDAGNPDNNTLGASAITTVSSNDVGSSDVSPEIGITGTPVIDASTGTLYVIVKTKETIDGVDHFVQRLHAVNISDGTDRVAPYLIGDTVGDNTNNTAIYVYGTGDGAVTDPYNSTGKMVVQFNALHEAQRPALRLVNNVVYAAWASHGDNGPYHGWVVAWDVSNLSSNGMVLKGVFNTCPNDGESGIWESGGGLVFEPDDSAFYFETGNGTGGAPTIGADGFPTDANYNEALVKLVADPTTSPTNQNANGWGFKVADYFIPYNVAALDAADSDFGSGAPILLPASAGIPGHPNLIIAGGKEGKLYVLDRDNLGHFSPTGDNVLNSVPDGSGQDTPPNLIDGLLGTPVWFNNLLYVESGYGGNAVAFSLSSTGTLSPVSQTSNTFGYLPGSPTISADGTTNGIVWILDRNANELHAYDASTLSTELWNSDQKIGGSDALGPATKFAVPTVANGLVYVGTLDGLVVYGLTVPPTTVPDAPTLSATDLSGTSINLSWTDPSQRPNIATGYVIEESTDGTTFTQAATAAAGVTSLAIGGLQPTTHYEFTIAGINRLGDSAASTVATADTSDQAALLDFSNGFAGAASQFTLNGSAILNDDDLELTDGGPNEAGSAFADIPVDVSGFTTQFTFQIPSGNNSGDGFTFTIQGIGPTALGNTGGDLGYGGIGSSAAVKFDLYNNNGEGNDSTGLFTGGADPYNIGSIDLTSTGVDLHSGDVFAVAMTYNGSTLAVTITDTQTNQSATQDYPVDIPSIVGGNGAYVGFTGGTGGLTSTQDIRSWTFEPDATVSPEPPSGLGAVPASATSVNLNWTNNATNQIGYHLDRATDPDFTQNVTTLTLLGSLSAYTDTTAGLAPGETYYYRIRAFNSVGDSADSNVASVTIPVAPPKPTLQQITNVTSTEIDISWQDNAGHQALGYKILRAVNHGTFSQVASLPPTSRTAPSPYSWSDTGLTPGFFYEYHIEAYNISGNNDFAGVNATTLSDPPGALSAAATDGAVVLSWSAPTGAVSYNVYRGTSPGGESATPLATGVTATSYTDTSVAIGTTYYFTVTAVNANVQDDPGLPAESAPSDEAAATPARFPTGVTAAVPANTGMPEVVLTWTAPPGADSYNIYRSTTPGGEGAVPLATGISAASFTDTSVGLGTTYYYQVTAVGAGGEGPRSAEVSAQPAVVVHVNFTSTSGAALAGYLADTGLAYGVQGDGLSFGWSRDDTTDGVERNAANAPDELQDSFHDMHGLGKNNVYWRIALPDGTYSVHLIAGDPTDTSSLYRINVGATSTGGVAAVRGQATTMNPWIENTVTVTVANGMLYVTNAAGTQDNKIDEIDIVSLAPSIERFTPAGGAPGASVTLTGTNFTGTTEVQLNGLDAPFTVLSATQIRVRIPAGATSGAISVTTPGGTAASAASLLVSPRIDSFTATTGAPGDSVVVTGENFTGTTAVAFHGVAAGFTVDSATQITATVPAGATTGAISVTSPAGTASSVTRFVVAPRITSFTPTHGPAGAIITLTGANFTGATVVRIDGQDTRFTVLSATTIRLIVPANALTGAITVTTPAGTATSAGNFIAPPQIDSFTPPGGPAGTTVVITGENFTGATAVKFHGVKAVFTVDSDTEITATVPDGMTAGAISVTTAGGTGASLRRFV